MNISGLFTFLINENNLSIVFEDGSFTGEAMPQGISKKICETCGAEPSWIKKCETGDDSFSFATDRILLSTAENDSLSPVVSAWRMDDIGKRMLNLKTKGRGSSGNVIKTKAGLVG